jgi:glutamine amidotransferase
MVSGSARQRVAVLDYGLGNLRSVAKALEFVADGQAEILVTDDSRLIRQCDRVVFPGQGAARDCMSAISAHHLNQAILDAAANKPFLGICMGLQVLLEHSAENGGTRLLGLTAGEVVRFDDAMPARGLKIPHMGWNRVRQVRVHPLWAGVEDLSHFYFVHSYHVQPKDESWICGQTDYGSWFTSVLARDNLFAVQFHPEKSADAGLQLLRNFLHWSP